MSFTDVQICNLALSRIGARATIASLTEASNEARACNIQYQFTLDAVLRSADWACAVKEAVLTSTTAASSRWTYSYTLPADHLRVIALADDCPFEVFGGVLSTSAATARITYVASVPVTNLSQDCAYFFILRLSAAIAQAMGVSPEAIKIMMDEAAAFTPSRGELIERNVGASASANTDVTICNSALTRIGKAANLRSLSDPTPEGRICTLLFQPTFDAVLRSADWACAVKEAVLTSTTAASSRWTYSYTLPADHLRVIALADDCPFEVFGGVLSTSAATARITYVARVASSAISAECQQLVILRMAQALGASMAVSLDILQMLETQAAAFTPSRGELIERNVGASASTGASSVNICNMALGRLGMPQSLRSLADPTREAKACNSFYQLCLDETLMRFDWSFAAATAELVENGTAHTAWAASTAYTYTPASWRIPKNANNYAYECTASGTSGTTEPTWPTTAGATVVDGTVTWTCRKPITEWEYSYALPSDCLKVRRLVVGNEWTGAAYQILGDKLLTDQPNVKIRYTARPASNSLFTPSFIASVVTKLAARLAVALGVDAQVRAAVEREWAMTQPGAEALDASSSRRNTKPDAEWITARL